MAFNPTVVTAAEWRKARLNLLTKEKEMTRALDALTKERRNLPVVAVKKDYTFTRAKGDQVSLSALFDGRHQLIIYHFMFDPAEDAGCVNCSFFADNITHLEHLNARDTTFICVSRAPIEKIEAFKARLGWKFPWYSSYGSEFNYDFHVTLDGDKAPVEYNYKSGDELLAKTPWHSKGEQPGLSVFYRGDDGAVYHSYSNFSRGSDILLQTYNLLDLTPLGRQEDVTMMDWKYRDEY